MALEINGGVRQPRLLDRVREANRLRHGSRSTEKSYVGWIRRFILFHGKRHPAEMGAAKSRSFSARLAGGGVDPESGVERGAVPLSTCPASGLAVAR
jgi:hypothetical protein